MRSGPLCILTIPYLLTHHMGIPPYAYLPYLLMGVIHYAILTILTILTYGIPLYHTYHTYLWESIMPYLPYLLMGFHYAILTILTYGIRLL